MKFASILLAFFCNFCFVSGQSKIDFLWQIERDWVNSAWMCKETNTDTAIENNRFEEFIKAAVLRHTLYAKTEQHEKALDSYKLFNSTHREINEAEKTLKGQVELFWIGLFIALFGALFFIKKERNKLLTKNQVLQKRVNELETKLEKQKNSIVQEQGGFLDRNKIETAINNKIGASSWMILTLIADNPSISNKEIAEKVSLSIEGVSSSLRRMYIAFDIKSSGNKKINLIMKAFSFSK